jgi:hypothetical protein
MQNNDFTMISPWNMWILHWNIEIVTMENRDLLVPITIEELSSKKGSNVSICWFTQLSKWVVHPSHKRTK